MMPKAKQVIKKVRNLDIRTKNLVDGLMQGAYLSAFKGRGIEFSDVREYVPGDDIRSIDWNVTARMDAPYVKEFVEERDLTAIIVFDASNSSDFGTQLALKKDQSIEIAASIAMSAVKNNDRVGLLIATEDIELFVPPKKGRRHALKIIRELVYHPLKHKGTDLKKSLEFLAGIVKRKAIIFVISDFQFDVVAIEKPLGILSRKNDILCIKVEDLREKEMPNVGTIELEDTETGECVLVDTSDKEFREKYALLAKEKEKETIDFFRKKKIDFLSTTTSGNWFLSMQKFFKERRRKYR